jgi:hypothetical protein
METRKQQQDRAARDLLIANMDPTMKAGFDSVKLSIAESITASVANAVTAALQDTNAKLDGFLAWKPELDARVLDLQNAVLDLQSRTTPSSAGESAAAHLAASLNH